MFPQMVAHNRASVPGCVLHDAQLCAGRLGCVEGHPWTLTDENSQFRVGQHSHESGPNGPATWAGPYGPSKWYGTLRYAAVMYGIRTDRFVSGVIIIQVIFHRPFSQQSYAINYSIMYAYFFLRSINLSVIIMIIYICIYAGHDLPTSITN